MVGSDLQMQFHLVNDASQTTIGGVLFQLHNTPAKTEAIAKFGGQEQINLFFFYQLADVETKYNNSKREYLVVVRCLGDVK